MIEFQNTDTEYSVPHTTCDKTGNSLTYRDGLPFSWSNGRHFDSLTKDGETVGYTYDNDGIRLSKTVDGVKYTYLNKG